MLGRGYRPISKNEHKGRLSIPDIRTVNNLGGTCLVLTSGPKGVLLSVVLFFQTQVWNEELATLAQKLASMCSVRTDCADCRRVGKL